MELLSYNIFAVAPVIAWIGSTNTTTKHDGCDHRFLHTFRSNDFDPRSYPNKKTKRSKGKAAKHNCLNYLTSLDSFSTCRVCWLVPSTGRFTLPRPDPGKDLTQVLSLQPWWWQPKLPWFAWQETPGTPEICFHGLKLESDAESVSFRIRENQKKTCSSELTLRSVLKVSNSIPSVILTRYSQNSKTNIHTI